MEELDLLKKDWKKQEENLPRYSYDELYSMIWKRSHSIVRWIFIISILEFILGTSLNFVLADEEYWARVEEFELTQFTISIYIFSYLVTFYFIYRFYRNYKQISTTDTAARLMANILKTRKTVKYYIGFVLISSGVSFLVALFLILNKHVESMGDSDTSMQFDTFNWLVFLGAVFLILAVFLGVIWLIYRVIYGILLKRLNRNYKELQKLDV